MRPETSLAVPAPDQLSTNAKVIGTNIVLAIILMLVLLFVSSLFNGVLDENRDRIEHYVSRFTGPLERVGSAAQRSWKSFAGGFSWLEWAVGPTLILGASRTKATAPEAQLHLAITSQCRKLRAQRWQIQPHCANFKPSSSA